jgi:ABC-type proline/glycine betaine transport system permease subunit
MFEWIRHAQVPNVGIVIEMESLEGQGRMTGAVDTGIAIITIVVLFDRATEAMVRCGNNRR